MKYANNKINIVSVVFLAATLYSCSAQDESLNLAKFQNCVQRKDVCMDYNGYGSDCVKGSKTYFVGSDCQRAMLQGHCWNEIMN